MKIKKSFAEYLEYLEENLSFPDHKGIPGHQGGSLPKNAGSAPAVGKFSDSLGVLRKDMPQIMNKDFPEFLQFARDNGVEIQSESIRVDTLRPAQAEYNPDQVAQLIPEALNKALTVSSDNYVLDGTNRYIRLLQDDPTQDVKINRIMLPARDALKLMYSFPKTFSKDVTQIGQTSRNMSYYNSILVSLSFPDHKGIPGHQGGSLPRDAGSAPANTTQSIQTAGQKLNKDNPLVKLYNLQEKDFATLEKALALDSKEAKAMLKRYNMTREEALQRIQDAREKAALLTPTKELHSKNGVYTPERQKLHDDIKAEFLKNGKIEENPKLFMTGGLPGSGKSSVLDTEHYKGYDEKFVVIDSDRIKGMLAQADGIKKLTFEAAAYHAEADDVTAGIFREALDRKMNIGIDGTLKSSDKAVKLAQSFKDRGYSVEVAYVDLPQETAITRGIGRFLGGGRYVDPVYIASNDSLNPKTANDLYGISDTWMFWNNDVPLGTPPILVKQK